MNAYQLYRNAWRYDEAPHEECQLEPSEWKALLKQGGLLVRNTYDFDQAEESHFWFIIKDKFSGIDELHSRDRNKVRHAFGIFDYRIIPHEILKQKGYNITKETFEDYPISDRKMNKKIFAQFIEERSGKEFEHWGIFEKGTDNLVGYGIVHCWDCCCEMGATGILTEYKRNASYPYYGLYHFWSQHYLEERRFKYISDGARTITEHSQIHDFLIQHFGFRKAYCRLEIHYQWWMKVAVNLLYPFRNIIKSPRVKAVLNMEAMRRGKK